jgi:hypothetical protein
VDYCHDPKYQYAGAGMIFIVFVSTFAQSIMSCTIGCKCWRDADPEKQALMMVVNSPGFSPRNSENYDYGRPAYANNGNNGGLSSSMRATPVVSPNTATLNKASARLSASAHTGDVSEIQMVQQQRSSMAQTQKLPQTTSSDIQGGRKGSASSANDIEIGGSNRQQQQKQQQQSRGRQPMSSSAHGRAVTSAGAVSGTATAVNGGLHPSGVMIPARTTRKGSVYHPEESELIVQQHLVQQSL